MFLTVTLRAHLFFQRGRDYLLLGDRVKIVDIATGRLSEARWMRHLHQVGSPSKSIIDVWCLTAAAGTVPHSSSRDSA